MRIPNTHTDGIRVKKPSTFVLLIVFLNVFLLSLPVSTSHSQVINEKYEQFIYRGATNDSFLHTLKRVLGLTTEPKSFAVIAGVSYYPKFKIDKQLPPAGVDLKNLRSFAVDSEIFDEIVVLKNEHMNVETLMYFLHQYFPEKLDKYPFTRFLFAFTGHGFEEENMGYMLTSEAQNGTDRSNSISFGILKDLIREVRQKSTHTLVLINSCKSGSFVTFGDSDEFDNYPPSKPGAHVITAGGAKEVARFYPSYGSGSLFFEAFLKGVKGEADLFPRGEKDQPSGDGFVTFDELALFLKREIQTVSEGKQNPLWDDIMPGKSKGGFYFVNRNREPTRYEIVKYGPSGKFELEPYQSKLPKYSIPEKRSPPKHFLGVWKAPGRGMIRIQEDSVQLSGLMDFNYKSDSGPPNTRGVPTMAMEAMPDLKLTGAGTFEDGIFELVGEAIGTARNFEKHRRENVKINFRLIIEPKNEMKLIASCELLDEKTVLFPERETVFFEDWVYYREK